MATNETNETNETNGGNQNDVNDAPAPDTTVPGPGHSTMKVSWELEPETVVDRSLLEVRAVLYKGAPTGAIMLVLSLPGWTPGDPTPDAPPYYVGLLPTIREYISDTPGHPTKPSHPAVRVFEFPDGLTPAELANTSVMIPSEDMTGPINQLIGAVVSGVHAAGPGSGSVLPIPPSPFSSIVLALDPPPQSVYPSTVYLEVSASGLSIHFPRYTGTPNLKVEN